VPLVLLMYVTTKKPTKVALLRSVFTKFKLYEFKSSFLDSENKYITRQR